MGKTNRGVIQSCFLHFCFVNSYFTSLWNVMKRKEWWSIEVKKVKEDIIPIYENEAKEKLINARELHKALENKRKFADWIKQRIEKYKFIENQDFVRFHNFVKGDENGFGNKTIKEYYLSIDMSKELCMVENNEIGRKIRQYFIETEKRYKTIINNQSNIFDFMRMALDEIEKNQKQIIQVKKIAIDNKNEIEKLKSMIDIKIKNNYCLASDIAEQLNVYSENNIPHSNLIGAIARQLGYKISYKHFYEDSNIAIIKDLTKNEYWQVYFKPQGVKNIIDWFNENEDKIYYEIQYIKNTKNGKKGEIKECGYKIENICYKVIKK